ncbi:hypothetical protein FOA52_007943 [Chlamydomonas sp. UWO 241]|nr:hypothetical protein FOA52_007943 [Chlamydomonas sp. UWO 241]
MQTSSHVAAAHGATEQEEAEALAVLGPAVLMNGLIFAELWASLGGSCRADKRRLRLVCRGVRALANSAVTALEMEGEDSTQLSTALTLWPGTTCVTAPLTAACLSVLSAVLLPRLQKLRLRDAGEADSVTDLTLLECPQISHLHIRFNSCLMDLEGLQACGQNIVELDVRGAVSVSSLGPLSACVNLERLNIQRCHDVRSCEPLSACAKLKRLEMWQCTSLLSIQPLSACTNLEYLEMVGTDLNVQPLLACTQLEKLFIDSRYRDTPELAALQAALPRLQIRFSIIEWTHLM